MFCRPGFALALVSAAVLAFQVPAKAKPLVRDHVVQQHKRIQHIRHTRHLQVPSPAAHSPQHAPAQPVRSAVDTARSLWASARARAMPALVAEARKYIGTNPTDRKRLWCATFMNFVLAKVGYEGTNSDAAKSFAEYGRRIPEPRVGAIAVLTRGSKGGHVGVVSGLDRNGNPIIISGNHTRSGVGEGVYARSRVIAYVMPDERIAAPAHAPAKTTMESPFTALASALAAEQPRATARQQPERRQAASIVPRRIVQQTPDQRAGGGLSDPLTELIGSFDRKRAQKRVM